MTLNGGVVGFSATIDEALVLLERNQKDYLERIQAVVHVLATLPDIDSRERAILELSTLLNNELAARAIAVAIADVMVRSKTQWSPEEE